VLAAVGFLYVRPIDSYLETRNDLDQRRAEVAMLRAERARLATRLERETSVEGLARQARRIGYVRPGEHLFIVEGTATWAKRHAGGVIILGCEWARLIDNSLITVAKRHGRLRNLRSADLEASGIQSQHEPVRRIGRRLAARRRNVRAPREGP